MSTQICGESAKLSIIIIYLKKLLGDAENFETLQVNTQIIFLIAFFSLYTIFWHYGCFTKYY
jgi:hypothetical protein